MKTTCHALFALSALLAARPLAANTVTVYPIYDNTIYAESGSSSNGFGAYVFTGTNASGSARRALLLFDPQLGGVPSNATIVSVRLELALSLALGPASDVALHRATATWGEGASHAPTDGSAGAQAVGGDATWLYRFWASQTPWASPGGDFLPTPSAVTTVDGNAVYSFGPTAAMAADVQAWVTPLTTNSGWILIGDESTASTLKRFQTVRLVIDFTPPGPGQSLCTPGQAGVLACPCANPPGGAGRGCLNSASFAGGLLYAHGTASLGADSVVLSTASTPSGVLSIVLQGDALIASGVPFGEGVRCVGGSLTHLRAESAVGDGIVYPDGGETPIAAQSAALGDPIAPGTTRWYQVAYRDPSLPCAGEPNFNVTQALEVAWGP